MAYFAAELSTFAVDPLIWLIALLLVPVLLLRVRSTTVQRWRVRAGLGGLLLCILLSWASLPNAIIARMERPYFLPERIDSFAGLIVLGGAFLDRTEPRTLLPGLGSSAERVIEPLPILRKYPNLKLLFTGGNARKGESGVAEADLARRFFQQLGVDSSRLLIESKSRNTFENASMSKTVPGVDASQPWLLVTSAWHMPRALATFRRAGWNVTPYAVDYFSPTEVDWLHFSLRDGIEGWRIVLREGAGTLIYKALGRV
ncbi:MAG: YdcF family protein [Betaproteobacteria bacterium]|nr:MAG: YdcF family protein [Betaproteobacteria bacterium]